MKHALASLLFALIAVGSAFAQRSVDAREIIDKINRQEKISYSNVTINGDLDLTNLANRRAVRDGNWPGNSEEFLSVVESPLTFSNCTFTGKVLAYRTDEQDGIRLRNRSNRVYNADFREAVTFSNCTFDDDAAFKYSHFQQRAMLTNNTFRRTALFKYTKFNDEADFSGSTFNGYADFKYTHFDESSTFQRASFERAADFKYTKFDERVDFSQARFSGSADFKYTHLPRGTSFDNTRFSGMTDFKYTTLDGEKFSPRSR